MTAKSRLAALRTSGPGVHARELRRRMTDAKNKLWLYLRNSRHGGFKFRRQVPLGPYVVDFLCERARLVVELDGGHHCERVGYDSERTAWLGAQGYRVERFWNTDVLQNLEGVWARLEELLSGAR